MENTIDLLTALLTPTIALIAVYIAWQQWRTAEMKRKQNLFEKRYAFFQQMWHFYAGHIQNPEKVPPTFEEDLIDYVHEAEFLFGDDIIKHIFQIPKNQGKQSLDYDWFSKPFKKYMKLA